MTPTTPPGGATTIQTAQTTSERVGTTPERPGSIPDAADGRGRRRGRDSTGKEVCRQKEQLRTNTEPVRSIRILDAHWPRDDWDGYNDDRRLGP